MELRATYCRRCNRPVCPECKREEQARGRRVGEQQTEGSESFDFAKKRIAVVLEWQQEVY